MTAGKENVKQAKPKIYLFCAPAQGWGPTDVVGYALGEDGAGLASHLSSSEGFSRHDMGLTSDWKHDIYNKHYPDGFELEWIELDQLESHPGYQAALARNKAKATGK